MGYGWLEGYCLSKKGSLKEYKEEWEATLYKVGGKFFLMDGGDKTGKPIVSVKLDPLFNELLREKYESVVPGYYMNKTHWSSVYVGGDVPDDVLKDMIDKSYSLVYKGLTKKLREEIENS